MDTPRSRPLTQWTGRSKAPARRAITAFLPVFASLTLAVHCSGGQNLDLAHSSLADRSSVHAGDSVSFAGPVIPAQANAAAAPGEFALSLDTAPVPETGNYVWLAVGWACILIIFKRYRHKA